MPPPSGVKLRDSCHTCATSKVKCSKDKPICTRCAERGTSCRYLVTQRTGRRARRRSTTDHVPRSNPAAPSSAVTVPLVMPTASMPSSSGDMSSVSGLSFLDSSQPSLDDGLDDFIASLSMSPTFGLSNQELLDYDSVAIPNTSAMGPTDLPLPSCEDSWSDSSPDSVDFGLSGLASAFPANSSTQFGISNSSEHPDCLEVALRLMKQLSCQDVPQPCFDTNGFEVPRTASPSLETIIDKNKDAIETIRILLEGDKIQDGYCLVVINMVISRILGRYAAFTQCSSVGDDKSSSGSPTPTASNHPEGEESDPQIAQRVLSELYQVQGLLDQISARMQLCTDENAGRLSDNDRAPTAFPFSAAVLKQLDTELRKRLSSLSLGLIDGLRQYWGEDTA